MLAVNEKTQRIIDHLAGLAEQAGGAATIDNAAGTFMAAHVEHLGRGLLSVAHYGQQNGDAMRDPDMVFWRNPDGKWCPHSFQNDYAGVYQEAFPFGADGKPAEAPERLGLQRKLAGFAAMWMENIVDQQGIVV